MSRAVLSSGAALLGFVVLSACSVLVGSEPEPLRCSDEGQVGPPACDEGQVCEAGICRSAPSAASEAGVGESTSGEGGASNAAAGGAAVESGGRRRG